MKKRILPVLLTAGSVLLMLSACGKSGDTADSSAENSAQETSVSAAEEPGETASSSSSESEHEASGDDTGTAPEEPRKAPPVTPIHIALLERDMNQWNPDTYAQELFYSTFSILVAPEDEAAYPELSDALQDRMQAAAEKDREEIATLEKDFNAYAAEVGTDPIPNGMDSSRKGTVLRADSRVVSVRSDSSMYLGGAHGVYGTVGQNFDSATGKELVLSDVLKDPTRFKELLLRNFQSQNQKVAEMVGVDLDHYVKDMDLSDSSIFWTIDNEAVTVYFGLYELGPYVMGAPEVRIGFDENETVFDPYYTEISDAGYVVPINGEIYADVNHDGVAEEIVVSFEDNGEDGYEYKVIVEIGGEKVTVTDYAFSADAYLVCTDDSYYIYTFTHQESDYIQLFVVNAVNASCDRSRGQNLSVPDEYSIWWNEGENDRRSWSSSRKIAFTDPSHFHLGKRTDLFGTGTVYRAYSVGKDGYPVPEELYFFSSASRAVRALQDIPCSLADKEGNVIGNGTIPKGSYLRLLRTDNASICDLQIVDNSCVTPQGESDWRYYLLNQPVMPDYDAEIYRIKIDASQFPSKINGIDEDTLFQGIIYAG